MVKLTAYFSFFCLAKKINKNFFICTLGAALFASINERTVEGFGFAYMPYLIYLISFKTNIKLKHFVITLFFGLNTDLVTCFTAVPVLFFVSYILNIKDQKNFIKAYFKERKQLVCAFVLIDIRHKPQKIDLKFMQWLTENEIAFSIIFTKSDKLKPNDIQNKISSYKGIVEEIWEEMPNYFITSSTKYIGKESLLNFIGTVNSSLKIKP